jgi:cytochrome oxidase assembly protein ShyY1
VTEQTPSAEPVFAHEKSLVFGPRMTVDDLLDVYMAMSPSEQIAFGRAIGVERVWLPAQRKRERNGMAFA